MLNGMHTGRALTLTCLALLCATGSANGFRKLLDGACAEAYGQCGGETCSNGSQDCTDAAYTCCPSNYACQRQSQWYWQCQPAAAAVASGGVPQAAPLEEHPPLILAAPEAPAHHSGSGLEEGSPEAAPEESYGCYYAEAHPPAWVFTSYLDGSGNQTPDGIYKETCKAITYDCTADILSASCATDATLSTFTNTSLEDASHCFSGFGYLYGRIIANVGGVLDCQLSPSAIAEAPNAQLLVEAQMEAEPEPEAEGPAADGEPEPEPEPEVEGEYEPEPEPEDLCGLVYNYYSKYDATGMDAPDGSYKEKCRQIEYDCKTDTISAECSNGEEGAAFAWIQDSLTDVSYCFGYGDISTKHGYLVCAL